MALTLVRHEEKIELVSTSVTGLVLGLGFTGLILFFGGIVLWLGLQPPTPVRLACDRARGDCEIVVSDGAPQRVPLAAIKGVSFEAARPLDAVRLSLQVEKGGAQYQSLLCSVSGDEDARALLGPKKAEIEAFLAAKVDRLETTCLRAQPGLRDQLQVLAMVLVAIVLVPFFLRSEPRETRIEFEPRGRSLTIRTAWWGRRSRRTELVRLEASESLEVRPVGPLKRPCLVLAGPRPPRALLALPAGQLEEVRAAVTGPSHA